MRMSKSHVSWLAISLSVALAACGGGGSAVEPGAGATATISGHATKGPVSGATVTAYALDAGATGMELGHATTASDGSYFMTVSTTAASIMLRMTGGSYVDEATGAIVAMRAGDTMTAVMPSLSSAGGDLQITPLTSLAQMMAAGMPGGMSAVNISSANAAVGSYFMVTDIVHTAPMNPLLAGSGATATASMLNYGMSLAAISQYAKDMGVTSGAMVNGMMADASDGVLDGRSGATPVAMGGMMAGGMMPATAGSSGLAGAMLEFVNSGSNRSGATQTALADFMQRLGASGGVMH